ncbi:MAG: hypothetical protein GY928_02250 [Colwellia sp.]|nr:hypothetical protein [Colwellia sp.]
MIDKKKCKGNGKAKGYGCGDMIPVSLYGKSNRVYGLGLSCKCYSNWLLNSNEGKNKLNKASLKASEPRLSMERAISDNKSRKNRETLGASLEHTQKIVNEYIRLRDKGKCCISSNIGWRDDFQAGHCYSVKQFNDLRFDYDNIHGQSQYANLYLEGDAANYIIRLPDRIGKERANDLHMRAKESKRYTKKWTREELKEIQTRTLALIKELKN